MNRFIRGILTGGLLGLATIGTVAVIERRRRMRTMRMRRAMRGRTRRTIRMVRDNAVRLGSAFRSGTAAFADRLAEKGNWGRT